MIGTEAFMTVGDQLATARSKRGLSLEQLATRTKIPITGLRALEGGQYEQLPAPIFTRGFIHAVALEVGLDPEVLVHQFEGERPHAPEPPSREAPATDDWSAPTFKPSLNVAASAFALLALVAWIWIARDPPAERVTRAAPPPTPVAAAPPVGTVGTLPGATQSGGLALELSAGRECWVSLSADGERVIYRLLQPGERATVRARERVLLRIGDAGALSISVNGGPLQATGADGEVRTMTLTAGGEPRR